MENFQQVPVTGQPLGGIVCPCFSVDQLENGITKAMHLSTPSSTEQTAV